MITVCCVCQRHKCDDEWIDTPLPADAVVTHGFCPRCADEAMEQVRQYREELQKTAVTTTN